MEITVNTEQGPRQMVVGQVSRTDVRGMVAYYGRIDGVPASTYRPIVDMVKRNATSPGGNG